MNVDTVNDSNFETHISRPGSLAVVEFSAKEKKTAKGTDNASAKMDTIFDEVAKGYTNTEKLNFLRVEIALDSDLNDTLNPKTSTKYSINHGPTTVFIKDGKEAIDQLVGHYPSESLKEKVDEALKA